MCELNALEKIVDLCVALLLMFGLPLLYFNGQNIVEKNLAAEACSKEFLEQISACGELTGERWREYNELIASGGGTNCRLEVERKLWLPGNIRKTYVKSSEEVLEELGKNHTIRFMAGDKVQLSMAINGVMLYRAVTIRTGEEPERSSI